VEEAEADRSAVAGAADSGRSEAMMKKLHSVVLVTATVLLAANTAGPRTFSSPEEARDALVQAAAQGGDAVREFFGPGSAEMLRTGDEVQDKNLREKFKRQIAEKAELEPYALDPNRMTLLIGAEEWPFAIPLVRKNDRWYFDLAEGKAELHRRTIGANELDAIEVCRGYVEAQQIYAETDWEGRGVPQYAKKIFSTEGKKDGLYWPGDDSPVAANFAKAVAEGYGKKGGAPQPYHGYFYKILLAQGPDARGGAHDYVLHGIMIGGFALVGWPAEYGVSGIMTFIVNHDGVVYQKDLGSQTGVTAKAMTKFNPDKTWTEVPDDTQP
jgi:hypothetical protein